MSHIRFVLRYWKRCRPHVFCWVVLIFSRDLTAQTSQDANQPAANPPSVNRTAANQTKDEFFDSAGVRIHYIVTGQGEPVILVHGFASNADLWPPTIIRDLSQDYRVVALDCRGHGKSDKPHEAGKYGVEMVNDIIRLMDHLDIKKAHIIGYSMGGAIVMKMLIEHPDRFLTAVIGGSAGYLSDDVTDTSLVKALQSGMSLSEAFIAAAPPGTPKPTPQQREAMKRMDVGQDPKALAAQRQGNKELVVTYQPLKANKVPTLVIYGGNDHPERFTDLKRTLAHGEFKSIEGASHGGALQSPEFVKDVRAFLHSQH